MLRYLIPALTCLPLLACEDPPKDEKAEAAKQDQPLQAAENKEADQPAKATDEEATDQGTEGEKSAEQKAKEKAQAEVEANPLTDCCRALGQRGFTQRSPDYMAASKACGEAMKEKKGVKAALPAIKKALGKNSLPDECQ